MSMKKWMTVAVPLVIGGGIMGSWWWLSRSGGEATAPASNSTSAPVDPIHERASLEEQLKQNPGHVPILLRLSEIAREEGKLTEAAGFLEQVLAADPKNADARLELGRALYESGDIEGAERETKQLLADHPDNVDGLYNLGAIYANQDKMDLARQHWSKAVEIDPASDSGVKSQNGLQQIGGSSLLPAGLLKPHP